MHSESGWIAIPSLKEYLAMLKHEFLDDGPLYFIFDYDSVHRNQEVRQDTHDLGIIMKFISNGMTDSLQPLDRTVFGTMKAAA
jgi:hypothetical protein